MMREEQIPRPHALPSAGASRSERFMQSMVHSATLPMTSCRPNAFGAKRPTGATPVKPSSQGGATYGSLMPLLIASFSAL